MKVVGNSLILDKQCLETARKQFCLDIGLAWDRYCENREREVFICKNKTNAEVDSSSGERIQEGARNYADRSSFFRAIICLGQLFICCDEKIYDWVVEQYEKYPPEWFCDFKNLRKLDEKLSEFGHQIHDTHVYFLPEKQAIAKSEREDVVAEANENMNRKTSEATEVCIESKCSGVDYVWFEQEEILRFKENNRFTSAICFWEGTPDVLAVAKLKDEWSGCRYTEQEASEQEQTLEWKKQVQQGKDFDQSHMQGMAGASSDGKYLWQIGINVDKEYAGQGLGHELVRTLKEEILRRGKVPFYGTSESHTISQTVGLKAGFVPAWTEVFVSKIN